jgi:hypothetical protein
MFTVGDRLATEHNAHVARTLAYMNPMTGIAVDRHALLRNIALHD